MIDLFDYQAKQLSQDVKNSYITALPKMQTTVKIINVGMQRKKLTTKIVFVYFLLFNL